MVGAAPGQGEDVVNAVCTGLSADVADVGALEDARAQFAPLPAAPRHNYQAAANRLTPMATSSTPRASIMRASSRHGYARLTISSEQSSHVGV